MNIERWERQAHTVDYRTETEQEAGFVLEWLIAHSKVVQDSKMCRNVFTFTAPNRIIAMFVNDVREYHEENKYLQEMEAYYNEH